MIKDSAPKLNLQSFLHALRYYLTDQGKDGELVLTAEQIAKIKQSRAQQFASWDWNYGESPKFTFNNHQKFDGGSVDLQVNVEKGLITDLNFIGDFLGVRDWRDIKLDFIGLPFEPAAVFRVLDKNKEGQYFGGIDPLALSGLFKPDPLK
jgi:lipoate-protein ligase A